MNNLIFEWYKIDGQSVDFKEGTSEKGPCATNVVPK